MFKRTKRSLPTDPTVYPNGVCLETEKGFYLLRDNKRYRVPTQRILESWSFPLIVKTTEAAVAKYRVVAKLGFRDGSLIHNLSDGKMYLISQNKRRQFVSPEALEELGVSYNDFTTVSNYEVNLQEVGQELG